MRLLAVLALLLVAAPVAEARRKRARWKPLISALAPAPAASWTRGPGPAAAPTVTPAPTATATPESALPPVNPRSVSVQSTEYAFTLSQRSVLAGAVRIQFDNSRAEDPHSLYADGPDPFAFDEQGPGAVTSRTVTLQPGTYVLFCPIADHAARGMKATLTVR